MREDRTFKVGAGERVETGYVEAHKVRLGCRDRMAMGDVNASYQRIIQLEGKQEFPPPFGEWEANGVFCIYDGRHAYVAMLMLGYSHIFVAWKTLPKQNGTL